MKLKLLILMVIFSLATACGNSGKNYVFVIDTSGSMAYTGNTIEKVKKQMPELMEIVQEGDTVTLVKFDEKPVVGESRKINSDEDKNDILKEIQNIKAEGYYTDMSLLIEALQEFQDKHADEKVFIVVLSDGLDDPSPENKNRERVDLKEYRSDQEGPVNDYYIYYISLGQAKSDALEKGLKTVSSEVKTIESKADVREVTPEGKSQDSKASDSRPGKVNDTQDLGISTVASDIKQKNVLFSMKENIYVIAAIIGLLLIGLLFLLVNLLGKKKKLVGRLLYQSAESKNFQNVYNLAKVEGGKLIIGSKRGSNLRISDLGIPRDMIFKPVSKGGLFYLKPVGKSASLINFLDQKVKGRISFGDKFKIGNYTFEYNNDKAN